MKLKPSHYHKWKLISGMFMGNAFIPQDYRSMKEYIYFIYVPVTRKMIKKKVPDKMSQCNQRGEILLYQMDICVDIANYSGGPNNITFPSVLRRTTRDCSNPTSVTSNPVHLQVNNPLHFAWVVGFRWRIILYLTRCNVSGRQGGLFIIQNRLN